MQEIFLIISYERRPIITFTWSFVKECINHNDKELF